MVRRLARLKNSQGSCPGHGLLRLWLLLAGWCCYLVLAPAAAAKGGNKSPANGLPPSLDSQRRVQAAPVLRGLLGGSWHAHCAVAAANFQSYPENPYSITAQSLCVYFSVNRFLSQQNLAATTLALKPSPAAASKPLTLALRKLAAIDAALSKIPKDPSFKIPIRPGAWQVDWNGDGRIGAEEATLLLDKTKSRDRQPLFQLDFGDTVFLRSLLNGQWALASMIGAIDFDPNPAGANGGPSAAVHLVVKDKQRLREARLHLVRSIDLNEQARQLYLGEQDDDGELIPNPRQRSHGWRQGPNLETYEAWGQILRECQLVLASKKGLPLALFAPWLVRQGQSQPTGVLDVGGMLRDPQDGVIWPANALARYEASGGDGLFQEIFGKHYRQDLAPADLVAAFDRLLASLPFTP